MQSRRPKCFNYLPTSKAGGQHQHREQAIGNNVSIKSRRQSANAASKAGGQERASATEEGQNVDRPALSSEDEGAARGVALSTSASAILLQGIKYGTDDAQ